MSCVCIIGLHVLRSTCAGKTSETWSSGNLDGKEEGDPPASGVVNDTSESNPAGRLQMHVLAAVAEFERSVIVERINAGLAAARERGVKFGRPRTLDRHLAVVAKLRRKGFSERKIAAEPKIPAGSVSAILRKVKNGQ